MSTAERAFDVWRSAAGEPRDTEPGTSFWFAPSAEEMFRVGCFAGASKGVLMHALEDGTEISFRSFSRSTGQGAVEVWYPGRGRPVKVHIK